MDLNLNESVTRASMKKSTEVYHDTSCDIRLVYFANYVCIARTKSLYKFNDKK